MLSTLLQRLGTPSSVRLSTAAIAATGGAACALVCANGRASADAAKSNPLLAHSTFPRYAEIQAEHVGPAIDTRLTEATTALESLEATLRSTLAAGKTPNYVILADEGERIGELVGAPWGAVNHLKNIKDAEELRKAVDAAQPKVTAFFTRLSQSQVRPENHGYG
jgi:Zn-dependent oligopeptidase